MHVEGFVGQNVSWRDLNQLKSEAFYTGHVEDHLR